MKKIATMAMAGLMMMSCTKTTPMASVRFGCTLIESGAMTKETRADTLQSIIKSRTPETMELTLKSHKTGTRYKAQVGGNATLPVGTYDVTGFANNRAQIDIFGSVGISTTPSVRIAQEIALNSGLTDILLTGAYYCTGLVIDTREVEAVEVTSVSVTREPIVFHISGNYGIAFINGDMAERGCTLTIRPVNKDNGDNRTMKVTAVPVNGAQVLEQGRYYILHPTEVEKIGAGMQMEIPAMSGVDLK